MGACTSLLGPEACRVRVVVMPDETVAEAVRATVPRELLRRCGEHLAIDLVLWGHRG